MAFLLLALLVFGRSLFYDFVYDDLWTIVHNPSLRAPLPLLRFFTDPSTVALPAMGMGETIYRPLPTLSFLMDFQLWGLKPWPYRLENLLLHGLNGALLFRLLRENLGFSGRAAALGAAVFLFHPVQTESVVWITQRSNLMCAAGGLAALLLAGRGSAWAWAAFAAALLSKETAVTLLPFLLLAAAASKIPRREKLRSAAVGAAIAASYILWRGGVVGGFAQREWRGSFLENVLVGQASWLEYLQLLAWPARLTASHRQYIDGPWDHPAPWLGLILTLAWWAAAALLWRRGARRAGLAMAWIPATLSLHLGFLPMDTFAAERFLYLPLAGAGALAACLWDALPEKRAARRALAAGAVALAGLAFRQTGVWRDEATLWEAAARAEPDNAFARVCLGDAYGRRGRWDDAAREYRAGLTLGPSATVAFAAMNNLAETQLKIGRPGPALKWAERALRLRPEAPQALHNKRAAEALLGRRG